MTAVNDMYDLKDWWRKTTAADLDLVMPKIRTYGDLDLELIGRALRQAGLRAPAEAGCMYYILGKAARAVSAYARGIETTEDTHVDITVYSMMARRIRQTGNWP